MMEPASARYYSEVLKNNNWNDAIGLVLGGDGSVAANGFWSALTIATTQKLPQLFYIEDNGYGISVSSDFQTPGGDISKNLSGFKGLTIFSGDGTNPEQTSGLISQAHNVVRYERKPVLLRLTVPRLNGHSAQDTQAYKSQQRIAFEQQHDPLPKLKKYLLSHSLITEQKWLEFQNSAKKIINQALIKADNKSFSNPADITSNTYCEYDDKGKMQLQKQGGIHLSKPQFPPSSQKIITEGGRINMVTAIRKTLDFELQHNQKMTLFGEDVGIKGGVHAVTLGLQEKYGKKRVFDTSLSEEGIIGRSLGMSLAGLLPVPEIQFRKYAGCTDGGAHGRWLFWLWRSLAFADRRSQMGTRHRLASGYAFQCRRCCWFAALCFA